GRYARPDEPELPSSPHTRSLPGWTSSSASTSVQAPPRSRRGAEIGQGVRSEMRRLLFAIDLVLVHEYLAVRLGPQFARQESANRIGVGRHPSEVEHTRIDNELWG